MYGYSRSSPRAIYAVVKMCTSPVPANDEGSWYVYRLDGNPRNRMHQYPGVFDASLMAHICAWNQQLISDGCDAMANPKHRRIDVPRRLAPATVFSRMSHQLPEGEGRLGRAWRNGRSRRCNA